MNVNKEIPLYDEETKAVFGTVTLRTRRNDRRKEIQNVPYPYKNREFVAKLLSVINKKGSKYYRPDFYEKLKNTGEYEDNNVPDPIV